MRRTLAAKAGSAGDLSFFGNIYQFSVTPSLNMFRHSNHVAGASRILNRVWRHGSLRSYSSTGSEDPEWFKTMRSELLQRDSYHTREYISDQPLAKYRKTLEGFLDPIPRSRATNHRIVPVGQHSIYFNLTTPSHKILPDGTDSLHSPGDPWVRRMWSGGSIRVRPEKYYDESDGFSTNHNYVALERIKDMQLRGENEAAKIFVTIERKFARLEEVENDFMKNTFPSGSSKNMKRADVSKFFEEQIGDDWGPVLFKEERTLVFLKGRTTEELEAFKAGQFAPSRYLTRPGEPEFSQTTTPTQLLLFRYSALTFNAHLIHLDKDYAQNMEGHRNLLVHGPLTLNLMLDVVSQRIRAKTGGKEVIESIEYRNLAPLYCDEELRVCGRKRKEEGEKDCSVFDVWIEGPTGGVAVKGTVYTARKPEIPFRQNEFLEEFLDNPNKPDEPFKLSKRAARKAKRRSRFKLKGIIKYNYGPATTDDLSK